MILTAEELNSMSTELNVDLDKLKTQVTGIEDFIRKYTNNNFTVKVIRYITSSKNGRLDSISPAFKVGDTIQISHTNCNDGIYVIQSLDGRLDKPLFDVDNNTVTLVIYPDAVKLGVMEMLRYNAKMGDKVGISSETISRHSVSYVQPSSDSVYGYPSSVMSFLKPYMKARF